jgi:hypothetical protein
MMRAEMGMVAVSISLITRLKSKLRTPSVLVKKKKPVRIVNNIQRFQSISFLTFHFKDLKSLGNMLGMKSR